MQQLHSVGESNNCRQKWKQLFPTVMWESCFWLWWDIKLERSKQEVCFKFQLFNLHFLLHLTASADGICCRFCGGFWGQRGSSQIRFWGFWLILTAVALFTQRLQDVFTPSSRRTTVLVEIASRRSTVAQSSSRISCCLHILETFLVCFSTSLS